MTWIREPDLRSQHPSLLDKAGLQVPTVGDKVSSDGMSRWMHVVAEQVRSPRRAVPRRAAVRELQQPDTIISNVHRRNANVAHHSYRNEPRGGLISRMHTRTTACCTGLIHPTPIYAHTFAFGFLDGLPTRHGPSAYINTHGMASHCTPTGNVQVVRHVSDCHHPIQNTP
jgi:hypothetical protein